MKMTASREKIDLSHLTFVTGQIGRLQTLSVVPVLPGDGAEFDVVGAIRLSPLRRGLAVDSVVDIVSFYVPHRHIYGDDWNTFIEEGYDETVTLGTETVNAVSITSCLAQSRLPGSAVIPKYLPEGYRQIWNRYFRPPTTVSEDNRLIGTWGVDELKYGLKCANLKHIWTALLGNNVSASDYNVPAGGSVVSLLDIEKQMGYLRTEQEREFFNIRYADIVRNMGGHTNISADDRPEMLMRSTFWASGYDVDGTDQVTLGQFSGRVTQSFRHKVPRYFVPEHGCIWTVALMRFPVLHEDENHYLTNHPEPTYAEIAGDPAIVSTQPPYGAKIEDFFASSSDATVRGYIPYGQWYRSHPNNIHSDYSVLDGFPFVTNVPTSTSTMVLVNTDDYDSMFQTQQLGHWQCHARVNAPFLRRLPSSREALLMGV